MQRTNGIKSERCRTAQEAVVIKILSLLVQLIMQVMLYSPLVSMTKSLTSTWEMESTESYLAITAQIILRFLTNSVREKVSVDPTLSKLWHFYAKILCLMRLERSKNLLRMAN